MIRRVLWRLLLEEGGWSRIWYGLATAMVIAGGGLIYHQATQPTGDCTFPTCFPDASNTGVPAGTSLTAYTGPQTITTNDTVIDSKTITSCPMGVEATGVIIRNSLIDCGNNDAFVVTDDSGNYTRSNSGTEYLLTIEDSEIDCGAGAAAGTGLAEAHIAAYRIKIHNCENGLSVNQNMLLQDSYLYDNDNVGVDPHTDGIQLSFGHWDGSGYADDALNVTIRHNTIYGHSPDDTLSSSAIQSNWEGDENVLIEKNLLAGGGYTLYCDYNGATHVGINYRVIDNHFSTIFRSTVGEFDAIYPGSCSDETQFTGNVIHETGDPVTD